MATLQTIIDLGGEKGYSWVNQKGLASLSNNYEDEDNSGDILLLT